MPTSEIESADDAAPLPIRSIGVMGAGTMGGGIAMNFLSVGLPVTIVEKEQAALDRGIATIRRNYDASVARGKVSAADAESAMALLTPTLDFDALAGCDLVIEAVFEQMEVKKEVFRALDRIARPGAILATNTSFLDVDEIAAETRRPEFVVGLHFFSPANIMRLLEVVRGARTAPRVLATAMMLAKAIGKVAVVSGVCPGFIGNRMLMRRQEQATALVMEGARPWDIDRVLTDFGFPMGPFQMSDLAGLDIGWDPKASRGETIRDLLCERGRFGQKTLKGYYDYGADRRRSPSAEVDALIVEFVARTGHAPRRIDDTEILERLLYPMVSEGMLILEEGIAQHASDIDLVWLHGYGWPVHTGGPMSWANEVGLDKVAAGLMRHGAG